MDSNKIKKIIFISFITMATFNMAHPVTPNLINTLGLPTYMFGVFYSTMAISNFVMSPIWGSISDIRGRKNIMIIGVVGYGISQLGFGFIPNQFIILIFRIMAGAMSVAFTTVSIAYITDISTEEERIKYMSYQTATISIAASVGALLGGFIGGYGYKYTFLVQFINCIISGAVIYFILDETVCIKSDKIKIYLKHLKPGKTYIDLSSTLGVMMVVMTLITISTTAYNSSINYYVESVLHMSTSINGMVMALAGVVALCMNLFVNPYLSKRVEDIKTIYISSAIAGISILLASLSSNIWFSLMMIIVFLAVSALITPIQQSLISKLAKNNYGEVIGIQGSFKAIGMVTGSLVSGFIFDYGNRLPFVLGGICCILVTSLLFGRSKNLKEQV